MSVLKGIHEVLQTIAFYGTGRPGKPKVIKLPRPKTAKDIAAKREAYRKHLEIEAAITYVPREEFDRIVEEHGR